MLVYLLIIYSMDCIRPSCQNRSYYMYILELHKKSYKYTLQDPVSVLQTAIFNPHKNCKTGILDIIDSILLNSNRVWKYS